jgi:hypothetical protein
LAVLTVCPHCPARRLGELPLALTQETPIEPVTPDWTSVTAGAAPLIASKHKTPTETFLIV